MTASQLAGFTEESPQQSAMHGTDGVEGDGLSGISCFAWMLKFMVWRSLLKSYASMDVTLQHSYNQYR